MDYRTAKKETISMKITTTQELFITACVEDMIAKAQCSYALRMYSSDSVDDQCYCDPSNKIIGINTYSCAAYAVEQGLDPMQYILACAAHEIGHAVTPGITNMIHNINSLRYEVHTNIMCNPHAAKATMMQLWKCMWNAEVVAWDYATRYYHDEATYTRARELCLQSYKENVYEQTMNRIKAAVKAQSPMRRLTRKVVSVLGKAVDSLGKELFSGEGIDNN